MRKLILFLSMSLFGWLGWRLGAGIGIMTGYLCSVAGSAVGVVLGVLFTRRYLD
jgi:uncharacterized membrane protein AbrB (regulator of aidB expression)